MNDQERKDFNYLNNQYNKLMYQARRLKTQNFGVPTEAEGMCYQTAAEICQYLADMTIREEREHWLVVQRECQDKAYEIEDKINGEHSVKKELKKETLNNSKTDQSNKQKKQDGKKTEVDPEVIKGWYLEQKPDHTLDKVVGLDEAKKIMRRCVLKSGLKKLSDHMEIPSVNVFFFYGPPGCGKTHSIEGFISELMDQDYVCLSVKSGDIHSRFSGQADKRVMALFDEAVCSEKNCVVFIDEIDGLCQSRDLPHISDFNMQLTTTFLSCFNDLMKAKKSIVFITATNYPSKVDVAMLDRVQMIPIPMPNLQLREDLYRTKLGKLQLDEGLSYTELAERSEGFSGRDIDRIVANIKLIAFEDLAEKLGDVADASEKGIDMIENGDYRLTKKQVDEVFESYKPKPNIEIEKSLNEFEANR